MKLNYHNIFLINLRNNLSVRPVLCRPLGKGLKQSCIYARTSFVTGPNRHGDVRRGGRHGLRPAHVPVPRPWLAIRANEQQVKVALNHVAVRSGTSSDKWSMWIMSSSAGRIRTNFVIDKSNSPTSATLCSLKPRSKRVITFSVKCTL